MNLTRKAVLAFLLLLLVAAHACSSSEPEATAPAGSTAPATATPSPTPTPINPRALLEASGQAMASLNTFRFSIVHEEGGTPLAQNIILEEASGSIARPDSISIEFAGMAGNFALKGSLITVGATSYMTNPLNGNWEAVPSEVSPLGFFDPNQGISTMMAQVRQVSLFSEGGGEFVIVGVIEATELAPLFGNTVPNSFISLRLTLDSESLHLKEAVLEGRVTPSEPEGVTRVITLSGFNDAITIQAPE